MILFSMVVGVIAYNLWPFMWTDIFYQGVALQRVLLCTCLIILTKPLNNRWIFRFSCMAFGLSWLELIDEALFKPYQYEISEYKTAAVIVVSCCIGLTGLRFITFLVLFNLSILLNQYTYATTR
jgi:hypothetical protein